MAQFKLDTDKALLKSGYIRDPLPVDAFGTRRYTKGTAELFVYIHYFKYSLELLDPALTNKRIMIGTFVGDTKALREAVESMYECLDENKLLQTTT